MKIKIKKNSGNSEQNLKNYYKKQLQLWDEQTLAEDLIITPINLQVIQPPLILATLAIKILVLKQGLAMKVI